MRITIFVLCAYLLCGCVSTRAGTAPIEQPEIGMAVNIGELRQQHDAIRRTSEQLANSVSGLRGDQRRINEFVQQCIEIIERYEALIVKYDAAIEDRETKK